VCEGQTLKTEVQNTVCKEPRPRRKLHTKNIHYIYSEHSYSWGRLWRKS